MAGERPDFRKRGRIEQRGDTLRVVVYAGIDPVTGRRRYKRETVKGIDDTARRRAGKVLIKLAAEADKQRNPSSSVNLNYAINEWLRTADIEASTRDGYLGYIERSTRPALGEIPVDKIGARDLENFYAELRRCRIRCDGKPLHRARQEGQARLRDRKVQAA
ncbi:MAG TPA: hypothetical protein VHX38_20060 [Pseudonocardiaceae bacterium]|jgi:hypothetical protein|nr:hypothetical protein [Pseudonocardiaceae bacterium]